MVKYFCDKCNKRLRENEMWSIEVKAPVCSSFDKKCFAGNIELCQNCVESLYQFIDYNENLDCPGR